MFTTNLSYLGLTATITTDWQLYHDFVNLYLANFVSEPQNRPSLEILSTFPLSAQQTSDNLSSASKGMVSMGNGISVNDGNLYVNKGNRQILVVFNHNDQLTIKCQDRIRYSERGPLRSLAKQLRDKYFQSSNAMSELYHVFQVHLRLTFHFPLFWLLETIRNAHLLHAAAVRIEDSGIILAGLGGVGKSTLASYLRFNLPSVDILTDNYLVYDCEQMYGFPEVLRLADDGRKIASIPSILPDSFRLGDRLHWNPDKLQDISCRIDGAFLMSISDETRTEPISRDLFVDTALGINDMVREFHNYNYVSAFPVAAGISNNAYANRSAALKECLHNAFCGRLTVFRTDRLDKQRDQIIKALDYRNAQTT